jgi:integrase
MRPLTPDEAVRFLAASVSDRLNAAFALIVETGFRPGKALGLCWQDICLEHRAIFVLHSWE